MARTPENAEAAPRNAAAASAETTGSEANGGTPTGRRVRLPGSRRFTPSTVVFLALVTICLCLTATVLFADLERLTVGLLVLFLTVLLLLCGVHVAAAMALGGLLGIWKISGAVGVEHSLSTIPHTSVASWSLTVIPMFVLMGVVLHRTGITAQLFDAARQWLGKMPGGLAVATNFSGAGLAAVSGSTIAISFALGRVAIPEMIRARYSPSLATGVVAMSGTLGQIIPPSVIMVIYAGVAQTPVGPQLLAGVVPGVLLAVLFGLMITARATVNRDLAPPADTSTFTLATRMRSLATVWPLPALMVVVIGSMYIGVTTATEAGALGALGAILLGVWTGRRDGIRSIAASLVRSLGETVAAVAAIMLLVISVHILTTLIALSRLAQEVAGFIADLGLGRVGLLLGLIVLYFVLGMFMDTLAMLLLTTPILIPVLESVNVDLIWFGVFAVLMAEIAMVTPPVGVLSFIVHGLAQNKDVNLGTKISLADVFRGISWFVAVALALVVLLIFVPDLALWLPNSSGASE